MAYIRFNVKRVTDEDGNTVSSRIGRIESDMPSLTTLQPNIIYNALSFNSRPVRWMMMDIGRLDRDKLGEAEALILDTGILDCDLIG